MSFAESLNWIDTIIQSLGQREGLYQYSRLTLEPPQTTGIHPVQTRLIRLAPGRPNDRIEVEIDHVRIDPQSPPYFEALSYVWGSAEASTVAVYIRGQPTSRLQITRNLHQALSQLRHTDTARVLWVDAICIDQSNTEERSYQVGQMGNIFRSASRVLAWLGREGQDSAYAMNILHDIGSSTKLVMIAARMEPSDTAGPASTHWSDRSQQLPLGRRELLAIKHMLQRAWFDRLWIRQEVFLGGKKTVMIIGAQNLQFEHFCTAIRCLWWKSVKPRNDLGSLEWDVRHRIDFLQHLTFESQSLTSLREAFSRCGCSDPRDRLYGILNTLPTWEQTVIGPPDYSLGVEEMWKKAVVSWIFHARTVGMKDYALQILNEAEGEAPFNKPTWIPNLKVGPKNQIREIGLFGIACGSLAANVEYLHKSTLRILGVHVQSVDYLQPTGTADTDFTEYLKRFTVSNAFRRVRSARSETIDEMAYVLHAGHLQESRIPWREDNVDLSTARASLLGMLSGNSKKVEEVEATKWWSIASDCVGGRTLFTTRENQIGLGPRGIKQGDKIVCFLGCPFPVVLRPSTHSLQAYHILGKCYVAAIMSGESFLGPLPKGYRLVMKTFEVGLAFGFLNVENGEWQHDDPRYRDWPMDVSAYYESCKNWQRYDIAIPLEILRQKGVKAEFFDVI